MKSMIMRRNRRVVAHSLMAFTASLIPFSMDAQGTLSTQGFGYPTGGASVRSAATGGAFSEFDAISAINPAALGDLSRPVVTAQIEPEYRTVTFGAHAESSRIQRIPLLLAAFPLARRAALAISASTFLDRSFSTATDGTADLGDETISTRDSYHVRGSVSDLRAAFGIRLTDRIGVGIGAHALMGANDVAFSRHFADSVRFGSVVDSSKIEFQGSAVSFGADVRPVRNVAASVSFRIGNTLEVSDRSGTLGKAKAPARIGANIRYEGIRGSVFSVGAERVNWSDMKGLGTEDVTVEDATNLFFGAEVEGPHVRGLPVQFRAGFAAVQLPFGVNGIAVNEKRFAAGAGIPLDPRFGASLDFSIQRATRSLGSHGDINEKAWLFGVGVQIRP